MGCAIEKEIIKRFCY